MNEFSRVSSLALACCFLVGSLSAPYSRAQEQSRDRERGGGPERDHPAQRDAWFSHGRTAPRGESAALLRFRAYQQKLAMRHSRALASDVPPENSGATPWTPLGPAPIVSAAFAGSPQDYGFVSGRATAVAIDPADATGNTVYIGGAHGGIWKSINAASPTASQVVWSPVADAAPTLAVGSIAIQPGNSNPNASVILVGTGEPDNSADSYYGLGILRSADGGATWKLIQGDATGQHSFAGLGFSKIAFSTTNPQLVIAAAATAYVGELEGLANQDNRGIYVSIDGGQTWNYASIQDAGTTIAPASVTSVIYHPAAGKFFAAIRFHGIYSSSDGAHWTRLADANQPGSNLTSSLCPPMDAGTCLIYRAELSVPLSSPQRNEMYTSWMSTRQQFRRRSRMAESGSTQAPAQPRGNRSAKAASMPVETPQADVASSKALTTSRSWPSRTEPALTSTRAPSTCINA